MRLRASLCFEISRRLLAVPATRTVDYDAYQDWRKESLSGSWAHFATTSLAGKDVVDFGCGDGALALHLASTQRPRHVVGVDLFQDAVTRARAAQARSDIPPEVEVEFVAGTESSIPLADASFDALLAFDCLEHVMAPLPIFREWHRILRPGGKCLIEWYPFKGPWGPHMESLIPIPWAHVIFGESAMFRAAERIYDLPTFVPRHWDLDERGNKKPNKWKAWSSFREQGYVNELDLGGFRALIEEAGLKIGRLDRQSFGGSPLRQNLGRVLMSAPLVGEYFVSFVVVELVKPL